MLRKVAGRCGIACRRWADNSAFGDKPREPSAGDGRHANSMGVHRELEPVTWPVSAERMNHVSEKAFALSHSFPAHSSIRVILERLEPRIALSTFNNVASESSLRSAIGMADSNSASANTIIVTSSITLTDASDGQLEINNSTGTAKTLTIEGQGTMPSDTVIAGSTTLNSRVFEIVGTGTAGVTVVFKDLEITKGRAHDGGILGGAAALGGGILIDGGQVKLSNVSVTSNRASGAPGVNGAAATGAHAGGAGGNGGAARGGGIYLAAGQLNVINSQIGSNFATGGLGGNGGAGGAGLNGPAGAAGNAGAPAARLAAGDRLPAAGFIRRRAVSISLNRR